MAHARQTIREAVATLLRATPVTWGSVLETRIATHRQVWPFLMVYATEEAADKLLIHGGNLYDRSVAIDIVGMLKMPGTGDGSGNAETVEDRMDAVCAEIETKLTYTALQAAVSGVKTVSLGSTRMEVIVNEEDNSVSHAMVTQSWTVTYDTAEGSPATLV